MRLSRHARNRSRLYRIQSAEIELIVAGGRLIDFDARGNPRIAAVVADGREILVVVALDNPDLVITLMERGINES